MANWYRDHVFIRLLDRAMDDEHHRRIRTEVCAPLSGEVLEIGFGTGLNLPHLGPKVTRLLAVEPMERGRNSAADRIAASPVPVEFVGLDGQSLPVADASVDAVLSTWTLCSIPDATAAVREIRRVLRPGGTFHFVEHGEAPDPKVRKWQGRLNGVQRRVACGCNMDRDIPALITGGGMVIDEVSTFYSKSVPKVLGWTWQGVAHPS